MHSNTYRSRKSYKEKKHSTQLYEVNKRVIYFDSCGYNFKNIIGENCKVF